MCRGLNRSSTQHSTYTRGSRSSSLHSYRRRFRCSQCCMCRRLRGMSRDPSTFRTRNSRLERGRKPLHRSRWQLVGECRCPRSRCPACMRWRPACRPYYPLRERTPSHSTSGTRDRLWTRRPPQKSIRSLSSTSHTRSSRTARRRRFSRHSHWKSVDGYRCHPSKCPACTR